MEVTRRCRSFLLHTTLVISLALLTSCSGKAQKNTENRLETGSSKIAGVSLVNPPSEIGTSKMEELQRVHAGWVSVIPYAFSRKGQPGVSYDHPEQWWGERTDGTIRLIEMAHETGMKVMLKPHVWVMGQGWTGDFQLQTEADWAIWERAFSAYILHFAAIADSLGVELFCIGTEYRFPARERPSFWRSLIEQVRTVYKGDLTYAANWDNFDQIEWWGQLDYVGIDAYFPLAEGIHPTPDAIEEGWERVSVSLAAFADRWQKPILFTEYGFQSVNGAAWKHWEVQKTKENINKTLQAEAYACTFRSLMHKHWFAGGFLWKWHFTSWSEDRYHTAWTPQGKPAEQVIANWYKKWK